jgi:drug/metabolite transporter (DMT)-like permease
MGLPPILPAFASQLAAAAGRLPQPVRATLWMLLACLLFAILNAFIREASRAMHPLQAVFFRNLFGLLFMLPWIGKAGLEALDGQRLKLYFGRTAVGLLSMFAWFWALKLLPFAEAIALSFASPLFATLLAALFLGEQVRIRRWSAILVGFAGVLVILRPGADAFSIGALFALASAALGALGIIFTKQLARRESPTAVVTIMVLIMTPMSLIPALFVWAWPAPSLWPLLLAMGLAGSLGHTTFVRALRLAEASSLMPYDYARLIFAAAIGWIFFAEVPDNWTWVGSAIIAAAAVYIARREVKLKRLPAADLASSLPDEPTVTTKIGPPA